MTPLQAYRIPSASDSDSGWKERRLNFARLVLHHRIGAGGCWYTFCPRPGFSSSAGAVVLNFGAGWDRLVSSSDALELPPGAAHYLEHVLFKRRGEDLSERFARLGAYVNAFTSYDRVVFHFDTAGDFRAAFEELARLVFNDGFTAEDVEDERGIILSELLMERDNPAEVHGLALRGALFGDSNAGRSILGTPESVRAMAAGELALLHRRVCAPGMLHFVAVGDLDRDELEGDFERLIGALAPPAENPTRPERRPLPTLPAGELTLQGRVAKPMTSTAWRFPVPPREAGMERARRLLALRLGIGSMFSRLSAFYTEALDSGLTDETLSCSLDVFADTGVLTVFTQADRPRRFRDFLVERMQSGAFLEREIERAFERVKRKTEGGYHLAASYIPSLADMLLFASGGPFPPPLNTDILPSLSAAESVSALRAAVSAERPVGVTTFPAR